MIIRKMTATYGRLQNSTLELNSGLNIITAPNESGKSTWCSFIKNMLYGIDSAAREKSGVKPDKTLYAPWSGALMSGSMELENGKKITLSRTGTAAAPFRELSAVYTGTAQPVPNLTGTPGEALLGIPREVFERSAFIGQGGVFVSASPELERRIAAIVQTGDENTSRTGALERLRAEARRRRYNKSGALPELERQMDVLRDTLRGIEREEADLKRLKEALTQSTDRREALKIQLEATRESKRESALGELSRARARLAELEAALDAQKTAAREADSAPGLRAALELRRKRRNGVIFAAVGVAVLAAIAAFFNIFGALLALPAIVGLAFVITENRKLTALAAQIETADAEYTALCTKRDETQKTLDDARTVQSKREAALLKSADAAPEQSLETADAAVLRLREELAAREGYLGAMGTREALEAKIAALSAEHEKLTLEYEALVLAATTLGEAATEIQNRMTPRLSAKASEIFAKLTANRYDAVALDRELKAMARLTDDGVPRESAFLSVGALDQLYLAVRLAICELALPEDTSCPLILDDALGSFDDARCKAALELFREMAQTRQILLFTCHSREAALVREHADVNILS